MSGIFTTFIHKMAHYMRAEKRQFTRNVEECIIKPLLRQRETGQLCDIVLKLNGRRYNAHKAILASWSQYFLSMFTCEMREKSSKEIDLSDSLIVNDDGVFETVLDYMYTGILSLTVDNVEDILKISDFLLLDEVKDYCKQFYIELGNLDLSNCLRVGFLCQNHSLHEVEAACKNIIHSRFHDYLIYHDEILDVPPVHLFRLLEDSDVVRHATFNDLKKLIQRWIDYDKENRTIYQEDLYACIKLWIYDAQDLSLTRRSREIKFNNNSIGMQSSLHETGKLEMDKSAFISTPEYVLHGSMYQNDIKCPVLYALVCNQGMKFLKILVYNILEKKWYNFPIAADRLAHLIPARQTVCNVVTERHCLYLYLCSSFPYPTDILKINILVIDLFKRYPVLYSFKTAEFYNPSYRTSLTNYKSVPPAIEVINHHIYIVGNKDNTGNLFVCSMSNHQYKCYQIPGARFISLSRTAVKSDRYIFIWFRHRTGPSEEFCIKKSVGFAMFDTKTKTFSTLEILAPEVSYDDFVKAYTLCVRDDTVLIYHPGRPALVLDEVRCKWIISLRKLPSPRRTSEELPADSSFYIQTSSDSSLFILDNVAPYTTSMFEITEVYPHALVHKPPPIDNISLVSFGFMTSALFQDLNMFDKYDEAYTSALHVTLKFSDPETTDSATSPSEQDSENDYEYDEDIYDYDYELEGHFGI